MIDNNLYDSNIVKNNLLYWFYNSRRYKQFVNDVETNDI